MRKVGTASGWASLLMSALLWSYCSGEIQSPSAPDTNEVSLLVGAGDIAVCGSSGSLLTARLLDHEQGTVFVAGDLAYPSGSVRDFQSCYEPTWGRHKARTRPAPGNHEYETANAAPYFDYFGANAGTSGLGYYRYRSGAWQVYSLNSNLDGSRAMAQTLWLRSEQASHPSLCSAAYFHHPLVSSGHHGLEPVPQPVPDLWEELYESGVDIVISAHEHFYERFGRQTPDGRLDPEYGIRQFVVGTGGAELTLPVRRAPLSELVLSKFGLLRLTLEPASYRWEFVSVEGGAVLDSGIELCHSRRPRYP